MKNECKHKKQQLPLKQICYNNKYVKENKWTDILLLFHVFYAQSLIGFVKYFNI